MSKRTSYHHGDLRNALIAAALDLIAQHGVEGFTLRDCAKKAGVSVAAPYRHFKDRDDVLAAVAADCMQRLGDAMDRAVEAAGSVDPLAVFRATGIAYVRFAVEHPAHFRVMYLPQVMANMPADKTAAFAAWAQDMTRALTAAQDAGQLVRLPLDQVMLAASCITHGLARMIVDDVDGMGGLDPDAAAALAITVTGVLGAGLLPRADGLPDLAPAPVPSSSSSSSSSSSKVPGPKAPAPAPAPAAPVKPPPARKPRRRGAGVLALGAIALASGRAAAAPAPVVAAAAEYRGSLNAGDPEVVVVPALAAKPPAGAYLLVGTSGPVAVLAVDRTTPRQGACPYEMELHVVDAPSSPREGVLVVGPVDPTSKARPRVLFAGLAMTGADASRAAEPLGVQPPAGVTPTYAIDLDGDGAADMIIEASTREGRYVHGIAKVTSTVAIWARKGKRWSRSSRCRWTTTDTIE